MVTVRPQRRLCVKPSSNECEDLPIVVARKLVDDLAVLHKQRCRHVARRELGPAQHIEIANRKLCPPFEFVVAELARESVGITAASPRRG